MSGQGTTTAEAAQSAQREGREFAESAKESTSQVAQTVKDEAGTVASEVKAQAQSLAGEAREQVAGRVGQQKSAAVSALRTTGDELRSLSGEQSRLTAELTRRAAEQASAVADYLDRKGPAEILGDVRDFARRKPGVFLLAAGVAGVVVGRIVRGTMAADTPPEQTQLGSGPVSTTPAANPAPPVIDPAIEPPSPYPATAFYGEAPVSAREDLL
jgi:hypothetical protein